MCCIWLEPPNVSTNARLVLVSCSILLVVSCTLLLLFLVHLGYITIRVNGYSGLPKEIKISDSTCTCRTLNRYFKTMFSCKLRVFIKAYRSFFFFSLKLFYELNASRKHRCSWYQIIIKMFVIYSVQNCFFFFVYKYCKRKRDFLFLRRYGVY